MVEIRSIRSEEELNEVFGHQRAVLFKNSMMCGISRHARSELEAFVKETEKDVAVYMVDVVAYRTLSSLIAARTGISHESPQAIYLEKGDVVWHASHFSITKEDLDRIVG